MKNDFDSLNKEFKNSSMVQNEDYLSNLKDQEESIFEKFLKKERENDNNRLNLEFKMF